MQKFKKSFTLVELMIVIAILAILSAIVIFALNPARLFDNFRDSRRVTDISSINKAIVFMESWNQSGITYGTSTNVYISLPDSSSTCSSYVLPTLPTGYNYYCSSPTTYKNTDGTGWIPINFTVEGSNRYLSSLPIDPVNNSSFFYTYYSGGSYELTAILSNPNKNSINDEGSLTSTFEIGSPNRTFNTPLQRDKGLVGYWDFNETSGSIAYDKSGNGYNGTLTNGPVSTTTTYGERNLYFDGTNDYVLMGPLGNFSGNNLTVSCWAKTVAYSFLSSFVDSSIGGSNNTLRFGMGYYNGTSFRIFNGDGTNYNVIDMLYNIPLNTWTHYVITLNGWEVKLYVNGTKNGTTKTTSVILKDGNYKVANGAQNNGYFNGYVDNVRIYNRELSAEEISTQYNQTKFSYGL